MTTSHEPHRTMYQDGLTGSSIVYVPESIAGMTKRAGHNPVGLRMPIDIACAIPAEPAITGPRIGVVLS
jgi:hypothetical protein